MRGGGPHIAEAAGGPRLDGWPLVILVVAIVLLFLVGVRLVQYLRERRALRRPVVDGRIRTDSLLGVWRRFLVKQPPAARALVSRYPWVVVLGESGAGKTTLIEAKADTRSQLLNDFPSHTDDALLKLYLGRRAVVHELGAELLSDNTVGVKLALSALWKPLCRTRPPLVVVVLSLAQLVRATPAELRAQALRLASRIKLLSRLRGAPILVRVCLSHLEVLDGPPAPVLVRSDSQSAATGSESLARLLSERRIPLTLDLESLVSPGERREPESGPHGSAQAQSTRTEPGPLAKRFLHYSAYLKFALPALPGGGFEPMVAALASAPPALLPVETLLSELLRVCEETTPRTQAALQFDKLYLLPRTAELQRANPLLIAGVSPPRLSPALHYRGLRGLWLALRTSNILSSWHAALCLVLVLLMLLFSSSVYLNHRQAVFKLGTDCTRLVENISEAKKASQRPGDSPVVWRNAHQAATSLQAVADAERYWPLLSRTLRAEKAQARGQFVESVRRLYFEPLMADNQKRALDGAQALKLSLARGSFSPEDYTGSESALSKVIYALGAWNASPHSAMGDLIRKEPARWASMLEIPEETLLRYVDVGPGCTIQARRSKPPAGDQGLSNSQARWFSFIEHIKTAIASKPAPESTDRSSRSKSRRSKPAPPSAESPKRRELAALQRDALPLLSMLQLGERISRVSLLREIAVGLAEECQESVADHVGPLGSMLKTERWLDQNKQALSDIATLVLKSEVKPVDCSEPSAEDLLAQLGALSARPPSPAAPVRVHTVHLVSPQDQQEKTLQVSERDWEAMLTDVRREMQLACWHAEAKPKSGHHRSGKAEKEPRRRHRKSRPRASASASALLSGLTAREPSASSGSSCGTPGTPVELIDPYNKESFERKEKPPRLQFDKAVAEAGLPPSEQARLAATMIESTRAYGRAYREKLLAAFVSYGVRADSAATLHAAVIEMMLVDSAFQTHLRKIADNANLGELTGPYLEPLAEQLAPFRPLIRLTTANKDGVYQDFDPYRGLLAQLAGAINSATTPEGGPELPLRESIPGIGRVALSILAEEEASPLLQTQRWLDKAGIVPELRGPFLAPMRRALCLGRRIVEQVVETRWAKVHAEQIKPLYSRFPFDRSAQEDVALAALDVIHPKDGSLWRFVREDLAPFVQLQADGRMTARRLPGGTVRLPSDMLPILNHLQQLSRRLWDGKEGTQRVLDLKVRPLLLDGSIGRYSVSRAYLSVGSAAAVGYNQMPADRALPVSWWNQENASAGIDLAVPDSAARLHASVDETKSAWSLFRLLRKGSMSPDNIVTFQIPVQLVDARGSVAVKFVLSEDPFGMFQPPRAGAER